MLLRVEHLAGFAVGGDTEPLGDGTDLVRDRREGRALLEIPVLVGAVEVIEHRDKPLRDRALGALDLDLPLFLRAAAIVRVLGLQPLEVCQQRRLQVSEYDILRGCGIRRLRGAEDVVDREVVLLSAGAAGTGGGVLRSRRCRIVSSAIRSDSGVLLRRGGLFVVLACHDFFAYFLSSSSSTTSASMTSSSGLGTSPEPGSLAAGSGFSPAACPAW